MAAIVSHVYGAGHTWYVGCDLRRQDITHLICEQLVPCLGIEVGNPGIVTIDRTDGTHVFRCRLNRSGNDVSLRLNPGVVPEGMLLIRGDCEGERVTLRSNGILIEQIHTDV